MSGKKLLVADDSLTIQKVIRLALSNEGYNIQAVSDGNDAIQQISLFRPDVVLIDVSLPGQTAFEVKRNVNQLEDLHEVRFVLMSSVFEKVDEIQVNEVVFHGRLTKPFDPAHLRQVLTDVLNQTRDKRMEKTSILEDSSTPPKMILPPAFPPPLPSFSESSLEEDKGLENFENIPPPSFTPNPELWDLEEFSESTNGEYLDLSEEPISEEYFDEGSTETLTPDSNDSFLKSDTNNEPDIHRLTQTTFQISNHEEELENPFSESFTKDFNSLHHEDEMEWSVKEPTLNSQTEDLEPTHEEDLPPLPLSSLEPSISSQKLNEEENFSISEPSSHLTSSLPLHEIEKMIYNEVQSQVKTVLEKMTKNFLPEIAEKIIKDEINRLLSDL